MIRHVARLIAFVIAVAATIDPALSITRPKPLALEIATSSSDRAVAVGDVLLRELKDEVSIARPGRGDAVVAIDRQVDPGSIRDAVPVSFVLLNDGSNVRLVRASHDGAVFPGERGIITVDATAKNMGGQQSTFTAVQNGVELGTMQHTWTEAPEQQIRVPFVTLSAGSHRIQVVAEPLAEERRRDDNIVELNVTTSDRRLSVAFIEYRPSWSARFVREAIESDPRVQVSSVTRASPGVERRDARPPTLTSSGIMEFDLLAIAAPEEVPAREVEVLRSFMAERGGTVVLLPDRRPSGPITSLIRSSGFDEVLFTTAVALGGSEYGTGLRASEFAVPTGSVSSMRALAVLPNGRAAIAAWSVGAGTLVVSGALDAWRYRASPAAQFASFWRAVIVGAARQAPARLSVEIQPSVFRPGRSVQVTTRLRGTEFDADADPIQFPSVSAMAVSDSNGKPDTEFIRLWPATEAGVFRGEFIPPNRRSYTVVVRAGTAEATAALLPGDGIDEIPNEREAVSVSASTGGLVSTADRLAPLVAHLRTQRRGTINATVYPMRSGWWILPFAIALCIEWAIRRRLSFR